MSTENIPSINLDEDVIKVEINWWETVSYRSIIKIRRTDFVAILDDDEVNKNTVASYLEEVGEAEWFEQCSTSEDFVSVDGRGVSSVEHIVQSVGTEEEHSRS